MLIRCAEIHFSEIVDIRIDAGKICAVAAELKPNADEYVIDAAGAAVIPGLHDHHLHFLGTAAGLQSIPCGPPSIVDAEALRAALRAGAKRLSRAQWLRGVGYHESIAGDIDRHWLDEVVADIPVRIQHRSGRLWILNSFALSKLGKLDGAPLERNGGQYSGRLYDADAWLRERIGRQLPDIRRASAQLLQYGITGFTDTSVSNSAESFAQFAQWQHSGDLRQSVVLMGDSSLPDAADTPRLRRGALKIHLHENELPELAALIALIAASHARARPVAMHCVTLVELVFALSALAAAGSIAGDRIEHAAIAPPELVAQIAALKLIVVTQPNFIGERGDAYLRDVDAHDQPWLYRLRGFREANVALAAGTDAPYGDANPWLAMQAAVTRLTPAGVTMAEQERLTPEQALELFLGEPLQPGQGKNRIEIGMPATLCIIDRPWRQARGDLSRVNVATVLIDGQIAMQI